MKRMVYAALLAAGKTRDSFLRRVPRLDVKLGPVRSTSFRLASRISNLLGAGYPVGHLNDFASCRVILVSMPESWLPSIVDELLEAPWDWKAKTVLLCNSESDSSVLDKLAFVGAATGSLTPVEGFDDRLFVAEGQSKAIRMARIFVGGPDVRVISMEPGRKALYSAGINFATGLALPLLAASVETLRACGIHHNEAQMIADRLFQRTLRSYMKAGRRAWEGPLLVQDQQAIRRQVQALFLTSPQLAGYFYENALQIAQLFKQDAKWLSELEEDAYPKAASQ